MVSPIRPQDPLAEAGGRQPASMMARRKREEDGMSVTDRPADADGGPSKVRRGRVRVAVLGALVVTTLAITGVVLLLADDDIGPEATQTPAPTASGASRSPAESAPATPADIAAAEAQDRYREFIRIDDDVARGGYANPERYDLVAVDPERTQRVIEARRFQGARVSGDTRIASLTVEDVALPTDPADYAEVRLLACLDVSQIAAVGANGESLIAPGRLNRISSRVLLQRFKPGDFAEAPAREGWYVTEVEQRGEQC